MMSCFCSRKNETQNEIKNGKIQNILIKAHKNASVSQLKSVDDLERRVFVSLIGLYESWKNCPSFLLQNSIFLLPCSSEFVFNPKQSQKLKKIALQKDKDFKKLLKWKMQQKLCFFMKDELSDEELRNIDVNNRDIHPFWLYFSHNISKLYDPVNMKQYDELKLDQKFWNLNYNETYYNCDSESVLLEISKCKMKYNTIMEIIRQSNPTLIPITKYNRAIAIRRPSSFSKTKDPIFDIRSSPHQLTETWFVSNDYTCDDKSTTIESTDGMEDLNDDNDSIVVVTDPDTSNIKYNNTPLTVTITGFSSMDKPFPNTTVIKEPKKKSVSNSLKNKISNKIQRINRLKNKYKNKTMYV